MAEEDGNVKYDIHVLEQTTKKRNEIVNVLYCVVIELKIVLKFLLLCFIEFKNLFLK